MPESAEKAEQCEVLGGAGEERMRIRRKEEKKVSFLLLFFLTSAPLLSFSLWFLSHRASPFSPFVGSLSEIKC